MSPLTTILLLEDDPDVRYLVTGRLAEAFPEARIIAADSAEAALDLTAQTRPSAIVLDLRVRGTESFELLRRARELTGIPAVVLTGDTHPETRTRALQEGAAAYLVKPDGVDELCAVLANILARRAQEDA